MVVLDASTLLLLEVGESDLIKVTGGTMTGPLQLDAGLKVATGQAVYFGSDNTRMVYNAGPPVSLDFYIQNVLVGSFKAS